MNVDLVGGPACGTVVTFKRGDAPPPCWRVPIFDERPVAFTADPYPTEATRTRVALYHLHRWSDGHGGVRLRYRYERETTL